MMAHTTGQRVECSTCGRWLVATSVAPYETWVHGTEHHYWHVSAHDAPAGSPCEGRSSQPTPVIEEPLEPEEEPVDPAPDEL